MGKSSKTTVGYHYRPAFHVGLVGREIDAFLEYRAADKTAWAGELTASGRIQIDAPDLFGGEKDQGGIVGPVNLMFGEPDQMPNPYLQEVFGSQTVAWRGMTTLVFAGGRFGAMNPYQQKSAYKIRKIKAGWDGDWGDDPCWYPETAEVPLLDGAVSMLGPGWEYQIEHFTEPNTVWDNFEFPADGWLQGGELPYATPSLGGGEYWTPDRSNIWLRRKLQVHGAGLTLNIGAENGCVVWINGLNVGSSNPTNAPIPNNHLNPVSYALGSAGPLDVVVKAFAEISFNDDGGNLVVLSFTGAPLVGINPAHALYYIRTDREKGAEPTANINEASLRSAAARLHSEGFGLCQLVYDPQQDTPDSKTESICRIIGGSFERSLVDGQWYLDLARGDYNLAALPIMGDDDILEFRKQPTTLHGSTNSLSVRYFDITRKESVITPAVRALGLIRTFGEIHETLDFPEIPTGDLALRVAERELRARITPSQAFEIVTRPRLIGLRINQYFRLQSPRRGIADMVCIVGERDTGTLRSGAIRWKVAQDIYSLPETTYVEVEHGVDVRPPQVPAAVDQARAFEAPYIEVVANLPRAEMEAIPDDAAYLLGVAARPAHGLDYTMAVRAGGTQFEVAGDGEWCPTATTAAAVPFGEDPVLVPLATVRGLDRVPLGAAVLMGDEILRLDDKQIDPPEVTLARGCGDTVPWSHDAGARIWFLGEDMAADVTEYSDGETVEVKFLTNTGSQRLPLEAAPTHQVTLHARQARPYPPHQLRVNGLAEPGLVHYAFDLQWVHRDRVAQADQLFDAAAGSIGPEPGTTYTARLFIDDELKAEADSIVGDVLEGMSGNGNGTARVEVWAVRDGLESWQAAVIEFPYIGSVTLSGELPSAVVDQPYSGSLDVAGGEPPYTWSLTGSVPPGLTIDPDTGEITGAPAMVGSYSFTVTVEDSAQNEAHSEQIVEVSIGWNLGAASYDGVSLAIPNSPASGAVQGMVFSPDGTRLYVGKSSGNGYLIMQYTLAAAWDLTTATYTGNSLSAGQQTASGNGISISPDGTRLHAFRAGGSPSSSLYQYDLLTPWDISTATYSGKSFGPPGVGPNNQDLDWAPDGLSFIYTDHSVAPAVGSLRKVVVAEPWDLGSAELVQTVPVFIMPTGLTVRPDGTLLWVARFDQNVPGNRIIHEYKMHTPWDLSTLEATGTTFNYTGHQNMLQQMSIGAGGTKLFIAGNGPNAVYRYSVE